MTYDDCTIRLAIGMIGCLATGYFLGLLTMFVLMEDSGDEKKTETKAE